MRPSPSSYFTGRLHYRQGIRLVWLCRCAFTHNTHLAANLPFVRLRCNYHSLILSLILPPSGAGSSPTRLAHGSVAAAVGPVTLPAHAWALPLLRWWAVLSRVLGMHCLLCASFPCSYPPHFAFVMQPVEPSLRCTCRRLGELRLYGLYLVRCLWAGAGMAPLHYRTRWALLFSLRTGMFCGIAARAACRWLQPSGVCAECILSGGT